MLDNLTNSLDFHATALVLRAERQQVIASNIANADTPGLGASLPRFARLMGPLLRSPQEGADTIVWLASQPAGTQAGGEFWHDRRPRSTVRLPCTATPEGAADRLWEWTAAHAGASSTPVTSS